MKKHEKIFAIALISLLSLGFYISNMSFVKADNNECSASYTEKKYMDKIKYSFDGNNLNYTGAKGLLYSSSVDSTIKPANEDGTFTIVVPNDMMSSRIEVYFYLANNDGVCEANKEIGLSTVYAGASSRNNLYDNPLCVNYRNKWKNNKTMKEAVSYCFEEEVSVQYSYEEVAKWIKTAEDIYNSSNEDIDIDINPEYKEVKDVKKTNPLVCDAFKDGNYERMNRYYHIKTEKENNCETTCKEEIEVNFSDPVATQAGLCFQYLIEIKSKVVCDSKYTAPPPSMPTVCVPTAKCVMSNGYQSDKGGPSEDFDKCVKKCDNGKYSQKCIDKCYTEVYEKEEGEKTSNKLLSHYNNDYRVSKVANGCLTPANVNPYDESQIRALYDQHQRDPGGKYSGGSWVPASSGCSSNIGQFYFSSLDRTRATIYEIHGLYSDKHGRKTYCVGSNGFLTRCKINGFTSWCNDKCSWVNSCGSNTVLTEYLAKKKYEEDLKAYYAEKAKCEEKAATCTNETTDYKIVVDNLDGNDSKDDKDKSDWQEEFTSSQKLNSTTVTGKFPSMVTLVDGSCEDGKDDPWHYHNIITFPGTWINNKTGQPVHSIQPGHEDFYTYIGNEYCTKLDSVPVNTAWYEWKVNQNEKELSDEEKNEIEKSIDMNIRGSIDNYGYFGWHFDVKCFYALIKDPKDCVGENCDVDDGDKDGKSPTTDYKFRSISLDNLFPSQEAGEESRKAGYNWSCDATNLENPDYLIQPVSTINKIQELGDSIYEGNDYVDYHIVLDPESMDKIRSYNNGKTYADPVKDEDNIAAGNNKVAGITVYKSKLLHTILKDNVKRFGILGCNNEDKGVCPRGEAAKDTTTSCYNEYKAMSTVLKGGK